MQYTPWPVDLSRRRIEDAARRGPSAAPVYTPPPVGWRARLRVAVESVPLVGKALIASARGCLALLRKLRPAR